MADLVGVALSVEAAEQMSGSINTIAENLNATMKQVDEIMNTLIGDSEGSVIEDMTEGVKQLHTFCDTLFYAIADLSYKMSDFLKSIIGHDEEAAQRVREGIQSRLY